MDVEKFLEEKAPLIDKAIEKYIPRKCCYCGSKNISAKMAFPGRTMDPGEVIEDESFKVLREYFKKIGRDPSELYGWVGVSSTTSEFLPVNFAVNCRKCSRDYSVNPQIKV